MPEYFSAQYSGPCRKSKVLYIPGSVNLCTDPERFFFKLSGHLWTIVFYKSQYKFSLKQDKNVVVLYKTKTFIL
jgi:hypothetical protein